MELQRKLLGMCSSCKQEDLSLMPSTHAQSKPGVVTRACNPKAGEVKSVGSFCFLPKQSS